MEHGADPNSTADNGATALHVAAVTGNVCTVQQLLQCPDIRVDATMPRSGFSALHLGVASADELTVTALLECKAALYENGCHGVTPVHIAAHLGLPAILRQLLMLYKGTPQHGAMSPLIFTCCAPREDVVKPALHVLTCVDWLGDIPMNPFLLRALMLSAEERQLSDFVPPQSLHSSFVASRTRTLQHIIKQKVDMYELPSDADDSTSRKIKKPSGKGQGGLQVCFPEPCDNILPKVSQMGLAVHCLYVAGYSCMPWLWAGEGCISWQ